jgi:hypothetical protein
MTTGDMVADGEASKASPVRGVGHCGLVIAVVIGLAVVTNAFYESWAVGDFATTRLAPQARFNVRVAVASSSLAEAWANYPGVWPPLYPTILYAAVAVGVPLERVNQVLFYLTLAWTALLFRRHIPSLSLAAPIALFAVAVYQYENLRFPFSEPLFVLLSLVCYERLLHYQERPSWVRLLGLVTVCAAVCLTRYNGLLWVLPLCVLGVLAGRGRRSERVGRAGFSSSCAGLTFVTRSRT